MDFGKRQRQVFVDMEGNLLNDKTGTYRKELINKLLVYDGAMNAMLHDASDDSELFRRVNALKTAIQRAKETVEKF
ncbi:MAG: hypothetical protein LBR91_03650 [Puniceicoccales bacterium]|jgi:methionine synthase I (cobalamin-dependent)|nr:hypothetical protein [Puniceicoccales bacterium]